MIILTDPAYNPNLQSQITSATNLAPGISIAKFLGAYGDRTPFNHVATSEERLQIARNLYLHAQAMRLINNNTDHFNDVRLIVSEGIYKGGPDELLDTMTILKSTGQLVYYQVIDRKGKIDFEKTFDVAEYWKDFLDYDALYLDYDTYNPDGSLCGQIGLKMPFVPEDFEVSFKKEVETYYNNQLMSKNEIVEILEE